MPVTNKRKYVSKRVVTKRKMPMYNSLKSREYDTVIRTLLNINYFQPNGWEYGGIGSGQALTFTFTQNQVIAQVGTTITAIKTATYNLASTYQAIYDSYKITKIKGTMFFTSNTSVAGNTYGLPMVYGTEDNNDNIPLTSAYQAISYPKCNMQQFGNSSGENNGAQYFYVNNPTVLSAVQVDTGSVLTNVNMMENKSPWLDTSNTLVQHAGYKIYADPVYSPAEATIGYFTFIFEQYVTYRRQQ